MITETAHFETTKSNTMVATTDQSTNDFTNCENKSDQLNVVSTFQFKSTTSTTTKLADDNSELENYETNEDVTDFGRPKKLQKSLNQNLQANNSINQQQSIFGQLESDFNLTNLNNNLTNNLNSNLNNNNSNNNNNLINLKSTTTKSQQIFKTTNNDLINDQTNEQSTSRRKQNLIDNEFNDNYDQCSIPKDNSPKGKFYFFVVYN